VAESFADSRICIIADDLTGACDAAAPFGCRGVRTTVMLQPGESNAEAVALCTGTRDAAPAEAARRVAGAIAGLEVNSFGHIFKKIDSVFRGNTFVEIAAAMQALPPMFAVIAPAFPALGRICIDGELRVCDLSGGRSLPLRKQMSDVGIAAVWLGPAREAFVLEITMRAALDRGLRAVFCEATCDEELGAIVAAARSLSRPILWIGSGGLAHALASRLYPTSHSQPTLEIPDGVLLTFSGSDHPVSCRQLAVLREEHSVHDWPSTIASRFDAPVTVFRIERGHTTEAQISEAVCAFEREEVGCLLLNGGDTALHVCHALGIRSLDLTAEFETGIPLGTARGGRFDGCTVILKSGGFGDADLLSRITAQCTDRKEVTT
jgi:D-threonate/D-erythronate kinase